MNTKCKNIRKEVHHSVQVVVYVRCLKFLPKRLRFGWQHFFVKLFELFCGIWKMYSYLWLANTTFILLCVAQKYCTILIPNISQILGTIFHNFEYYCVVPRKEHITHPVCNYSNVVATCNLPGYPLQGRPRSRASRLLSEMDK